MKYQLLIIIPARPHYLFSLKVTVNKESYYVGLKLPLPFTITTVRINAVKSNACHNPCHACTC